MLIMNMLCGWAELKNPAYVARTWSLVRVLNLTPVFFHLVTHYQTNCTQIKNSKHICFIVAYSVWTKGTVK